MNASSVCCRRSLRRSSRIVGAVSARAGAAKANSAVAIRRARTEADGIVRGRERRRRHPRQHVPGRPRAGRRAPVRRGGRPALPRRRGRRGPAAAPPARLAAALLDVAARPADARPALPLHRARPARPRLERRARRRLRQADARRRRRSRSSTSSAIERARVMGHDWGAVAAALMARDRARARRSALLLVDFPRLWDTSSDPRQLLGVAHMPFLGVARRPRSSRSVAELILKRGSRPQRRRGRGLRRRPQAARAPARDRRRSTARSSSPSCRALRDRRERRPCPSASSAARATRSCRWSPGSSSSAAPGHFLPEDKPDAVIGHASRSSRALR